MIQQMSSKALMEVLDKAESGVEELRNNVNTMRSELDRQLSVFRNAMEFASQSIVRFDESLIQDEAKSNTVYLLADQDKVAGSYDTYGLTVHPHTTPNSNSVFNFMTATGPVYKDNANISINSEISPVFSNMLMHDAIKNKSTAFDELLEDEFTLKVTVNANDLLSSTACNTIEILPLIPGSFDITAIRVYTMQDHRTQSTIPSINMETTFPSVGASKILLGKTVELYSCEMDIKVRFQNAAGKFPFGIKHLYFLNSSYNADSYMVFKVKRNHYVDWISDDITIHDQNGIRNTTCSEEGIQLFMNYVDGNLETEITPSKGLIQDTLPRNVYDFYVRIPITKGIVSLKFKTIAER